MSPVVQQRRQLVDHGVGGRAGLDHDDDRARPPQAGDEVGHRLAGHERALAAVLGDQAAGALRRAVVQRDGVAVPGQVPGQVAAHDRQAGDADVRGGLRGGCAAGCSVMHSNLQRAAARATRGARRVTPQLACGHRSRSGPVESRRDAVVQQSVSELESAAYRSALGVIRGVEPRVADAIVAELERPASLAQAHRQRELRLARGAAGHGQLVQRQVRRGHDRPPLLRRLQERGHHRVAGRRARPRAVRGAARLRPAALGHRRQPGRVLGHPDAAGRAPRAGRAGPAAHQRPGRRAVGAAPRRPGQPAAAGHVAGRRRPPDPRVPAQHLGQDVRPAQLRHRPGQRAAGLRRAARAGPRVPAADHHRRLLGLPAADQLRDHARDRRRGRRHADGGHGPLRRAGRGQGADRRLRPDPARPPDHHDHPQVAARAARRPGAVRR